MADTIEETMRQQGAKVYQDGKEQPGEEPQSQAQEEPKQEPQPNKEPKQEPQEEPKQEAQPKGEEPKQEPQGQQEPKEGDQAKKTWLEQFNERFQTQYENEDNVKELFDYKSKYDDLQGKVKTKDEALSQASDPTSYFANESLMKVNEIVKQHNVDLPTAAQLVSSDFSQMSDEQVVLMDNLLEQPEYHGDEDLLREDIQKQYGLDINPDDYEDDERPGKEKEVRRGKKRMEVAARKARDKFQKMQQVELPEKQNLEEGVQQRDEALKQSAEKNVDKFISDISKIDYGEGMEYEVDDEWKNEHFTKDSIQKFALDYKLDLSDEQSYEQAKEVYKMAYVYKNLPKIIKNHKDKLQTQQKDEEFSKYNNPRPNNGQQAPSETPKEKTREKVNQDIAADMGVRK